MAVLIKIHPSKLTADVIKNANMTILVGPSHDASKEVSIYQMNGLGYGYQGKTSIPPTLLPIKQGGTVMEYEAYVGLGLRHMRMQLARLAQNKQIQIQVTNPKTDLASAGSAWVATALTINQILNPSTLP